MESWEKELFGETSEQSGKPESEKLGALAFEQKKQEALLEAVRSREMSKSEIDAMFEGFDALRKELEEKRAELQKTEDEARKAALEADIAALEEQIAGFDEFTKDDEFAIEK